MTHLSEETRYNAGKYDSILSTMFDFYINERDDKKKNNLELEIETTLIQMSGNVNQGCYEVYKEIYYSIKNVRTEDG